MDKARLFYRAWRYRLKLERREVRLILDTLQPGDDALDIGGHKGAMTWWMRHAVGATGRVDTFEPQPTLASRLERLTRSGYWERVRIENQGMSSQPGSLTLHVPLGGPSPSATFRPAAGDVDAMDRYEVPVTTVDEWVHARKRNQLRLIKVDVEGHELEVFCGAEHTLKIQRPALLFECEQRHLGERDMREVFDFLLGLGYEGHCVADDQLLPVAEFHVDRHQRHDGPFGYQNNFWFTAPGHG